MIVNMPKKLNTKEALNFIDTLHALPDDSEYLFDFKDLSWSEPFGLLSVSCELSRFIARHSVSKIGAVNFESNAYEANMGFFKAFGINYGKLPGEAQGNSGYSPIEWIDVAEIQEEANQEGNHVGLVIEKKAYSIAQILAQASSGDMVDTLTYSMVEVMRNVVEHSEADQFGMCSQFWPKLGKVEFSLIDRGVGLQTTLSRNSKYLLKTDSDALDLAILPGISGKLHKNRRRRRDDVWAHTGFGLFMTSRICGDLGSFMLLSGHTGLLITQNKRYYFRSRYSGTAIRLTIFNSKISSHEKLLQLYRDEGDRIEKILRSIDVLEVSIVSQLISDFYEGV